MLERLERAVIGRAVNAYWELRFGIKTRGVINPAQLGLAGDACAYSALSYSAIFRALDHPPKWGGFVDYGCGLGRVLACAAWYPFARVVGMELSPTLAARCRENMATARWIARDRIKVIEGDAAAWVVPDDMAVFHFANPFVGETLKAVVANIRLSLERVPRRAWIVFGNAMAMTPLMDAGDVIPREWVKARRDIAWPYQPKPAGAADGEFVYRIWSLDSLE